jgi:ribosomal protein L4
MPFAFSRVAMALRSPTLSGRRCARRARTSSASNFFVCGGKVFAPKACNNQLSTAAVSA